MELILAALMILASGSIALPLPSHNITVNCVEVFVIYPDFKLNRSAPTPLVDLKASVTLGDGLNTLDISWAVKVDATFKDIKGVDIDTSERKITCTYNPPLDEAINTFPVLQTMDQVWFNYQVTDAFDLSYYLIEAWNLPKPPPENGMVSKAIMIYTPPKPEPTVSETTTEGHSCRR